MHTQADTFILDEGKKPFKLAITSCNRYPTPHVSLRSPTPCWSIGKFCWRTLLEILDNVLAIWRVGQIGKKHYRNRDKTRKGT